MTAMGNKVLPSRKVYEPPGNHELGSYAPLNKDLANPTGRTPPAAPPNHGSETVGTGGRGHGYGAYLGPKR
jgi:hypothetical protein